MTDDTGAVTHAMGIDCDDGEVARKMTLYRLANGSFGVSMRTTWPGEAEPIVTRFGLSLLGLDMLTQLLNGAHRIHEFPLPTKPGEVI